MPTSIVGVKYIFVDIEYADEITDLTIIDRYNN